MKKKIVEFTRVFYENYRSKADVIVNVGGARSSKSYSIAQLFVQRFHDESGKKFLITRKTMPALRVTAMKVVLDMIKEWGFYEYCDHNKSHNIIEYKDNYMLFCSVDDSEKIKSTEFNYIWMEEANEFSYRDFRILKLRLSGDESDGKVNQIFMSLNPSDELSWIKLKLIKQRGVQVIGSTYKDNPFLSEHYVNSLEQLKEEDDVYWRIYGLGEWARLKSLIYSNWELVENVSHRADEIIYGLDFGFNNPTALIEISFSDRTVYERELLYETGLTNNELIKRLEELVKDKNRPIYADSSEPARIKEIADAGFNIHPAIKDSRKNGIDFVKRQNIRIVKGSENLIKEKQSYKWKETKDGNLLDEPVKFNDHLMDAERYAIYTHLSKDEIGDWGELWDTDENYDLN